MDVHGPRVAREGVAPDALEELISREYEPAVVEKLPEQIEFLRRELDLLVSDLGLAATRVDVEVAVLEDRARDVFPVGRRAAQDRLDARDELAWVEGLRQVVVGADLEP